MTTDRSDGLQTLRNWGEDGDGPMNGAVGRAVSDADFDLIRSRPGVASICYLGCGNGFLAGRLGAPGYRAEGVDASDRRLAIAHAVHACPGVRFRQGLFGEPHSRELETDGPFDMVVSVDVIEHLFRPRTLVETAAPWLWKNVIVVATKRG